MFLLISPKTNQLESLLTKPTFLLQICSWLYEHQKCIPWPWWGIEGFSSKIRAGEAKFSNQVRHEYAFWFLEKNHMSVWYSLLETVFIKSYHLALDNQNLVSYNLLFGLLKTFRNPTTDFILGPYLWAEIKRSTVNISL